jgi:radical SAM protein with 4Fe4S-binding SPASM domain
MRDLDCRIILTEKCNASCKHCFNADARHGKSMDVDKFMDFVTTNQHNLKHLQLKIMGGEPTIHPRFEELVEKASDFFLRVIIFTNGTTMNKITRNPFFKNNPNIIYTINGFTFDVPDFDQYKDFVNNVSLHFVLSMGGADEIVQKALHCANVMKDKVTILYSPDTQVDLFNKEVMNRYRKIWVKGIKDLIPKLRKMGVPFYPDHSLPLCFFTTEMIEELAEADFTDITLGLSGCDCANLGLIDTDFNLHHCNQTRIKLGTLLNDDNSFKNIDEIREMIAGGPRTKIECIQQISKECKECPSLPICRNGCYYNTLQKHGSL